MDFCCLLLFRKVIASGLACIFWAYWCWPCWYAGMYCRFVVIVDNDSATASVSTEQVIGVFLEELLKLQIVPAIQVVEPRTVLKLNGVGEPVAVKDIERLSTEKLDLARCCHIAKQDD